jgi:hypothetical protein
MLQVFQLFHMYILIVLSRCCKSISGYCITCMLQAYVSSVLGISYVFYLDVAKVDPDVACVCSGFQVFSAVLQVFQTYVANVSTVSDACCKCFI